MGRWVYREFVDMSDPFPIVRRVPMYYEEDPKDREMVVYLEVLPHESEDRPQNTEGQDGDET